mgnify:CR=1 FL=1
MLDYRLFQHQNFLKKVQKKLDFLPKNGKFCVKKSLSPEKFLRFFFFLSSKFPACFFPAFFTIIGENVKMRSAFAERTRNYLLFFVSEVINMRPQVLAFLCFGRQNSLNNDSILQTFLLQTATILIRLGNIAVN